MMKLHARSGFQKIQSRSTTAIQVGRPIPERLSVLVHDPVPTIDGQPLGGNAYSGSRWPLLARKLANRPASLPRAGELRTPWLREAKSPQLWLPEVLGVCSNGATDSATVSDNAPVLFEAVLRRISRDFPGPVRR